MFSRVTKARLIVSEPEYRPADRDTQIRAAQALIFAAASLEELELDCAVRMNFHGPPKSIRCIKRLTAKRYEWLTSDGSADIRDFSELQ
jgi:hypothetical protein